MSRAQWGQVTLSSANITNFFHQPQPVLYFYSKVTLKPCKSMKADSCGQHTLNTSLQRQIDVLHWSLRGHLKRHGLNSLMYNWGRYMHWLDIRSRKPQTTKTSNILRWFWDNCLYDKPSGLKSEEALNLLKFWTYWILFVLLLLLVESCFTSLVQRI